MHSILTSLFLPWIAISSGFAGPPSLAAAFANVKAWRALHRFTGSRPTSLLYESPTDSSGKGFGKKNVVSKENKNSLSDSFSDVSQKWNKAQEDETVVSSFSSSSSSLPGGAEAIARLRSEDFQRKEKERESIQQLKQIDQELLENPSMGVIPEIVANRMGARMLPAIGLTVFGTMSTFVLFWYLTSLKDLAIPTVIVGYSTSVLLVLGLVSISYSVMSTSWDVEREGTFWGWEEFQRNIKNVQEGLQRSRENAILRDKLDRMTLDKENETL